MVTVALIGADGAGKTTIGRRLQEGNAHHIKYLYLGVNPDASNHMLPTTRLILKIKRLLGRKTHMGGPPDRGRLEPRRRSLPGRALGATKSALWMSNQLAEEWYRQCLAWYYQCRGFIVLFDRHFYSDYFAHDIAGGGPSRSFSRRVHGFVLKRFYPRPDLVVLLDAPADVLFQRKPEGTVELIDRRRKEYFQLREHVPHFAVVNADQSLETVTREVMKLIDDFHPGGK